MPANDSATTLESLLTAILALTAGGAVWPGYVAQEECARPSWNSYNRYHFRQDWAEEHGYRTPYTCTLFSDPADVDREHIVPWRTIREESPSCRVAQERYQDRRNLAVAVSRVNRDKSDRDFGAWQPEENRCWFAARVKAIKEAWRLPIVGRERAALNTVLAACSEYRKRTWSCDDDLLLDMLRPTRKVWLLPNAGERQDPP